MPTYQLINDDGAAVREFTTATDLAPGVHNMRPVGELNYQLLNAGAQVVHEFASSVSLTQGPVRIKRVA